MDKWLKEADRMEEEDEKKRKETLKLMTCT